MLGREKSVETGSGLRSARTPYASQEKILQLLNRHICAKLMVIRSPGLGTQMHNSPGYMPQLW